MKRLVTLLLPLAMFATDLPAADHLRGGDHHMHIHSQLTTQVWSAMCEAMPEACGENASGPPPLTAAQAVQALDEAGLAKGVVMSTAYFFGVPELAETKWNDHRNVRAENEYVAEQVAYFPDTLVGFFSVNPLAEYAVHEIAYWAETGGLTGLKLHLANSDLRFDDPEHIGQLKAVFGVLDDYGLPVGIHLRNRNPEYGYEQADLFIREVARHTPNVVIHLAHMAGWGGWDPGTDGAVRAFLDAIERGDLDRDQVWFDLAAVVLTQLPPEAYATLPDRIRQIGADRILFATDWNAVEDPAPHMQTLRSVLDLTDEEWDTIFSNQAPYLR